MLHSIKILSCFTVVFSLAILSPRLLASEDSNPCQGLLEKPLRSAVFRNQIFNVKGSDCKKLKTLKEAIHEFGMDEAFKQKLLADAEDKFMEYVSMQPVLDCVDTHREMNNSAETIEAMECLWSALMGDLKNATFEKEDIDKAASASEPLFTCFRYMVQTVMFDYIATLNLDFARSVMSVWQGMRSPYSVVFLWADLEYARKEFEDRLQASEISSLQSEAVEGAV